MNILLHICCAPCAMSCVDIVRSEGHKFAGYFDNPNIHPYSEYLKRKEAVEAYSKESGFNVLYGEYDLPQFFQCVAFDESVQMRCPACWWLRLSRAARVAAENGFDGFSTTLLASPYQDNETLVKVGLEVAGQSGLTFHHPDFRSGFKQARALAKEKGIYCQSYCGCLFSEKERIERRASRKEKVAREGA